MRLLISPAKKMVTDLDSLPVRTAPAFLERTGELLAALRALSPRQLQTLWKCNDDIARLNIERLAEMDLTCRLTPAVLSYEGIQYRYMAPGVLEGEALDYLQEHLRILSGFYGMLRPFDGVTPYRLEMGARLHTPGRRDLYQFWGDSLAAALAEETDTVLNLASKEYSRAVAPHLPPSVRFVTCVFGERRGDKVVEKGTLCKMARGRMVRFLAQRGALGLEEAAAFRELGFRFAPGEGAENEMVFIKEDD